MSSAEIAPPAEVAGRDYRFWNVYGEPLRLSPLDGYAEWLSHLGCQGPKYGMREQLPGWGAQAAAARWLDKGTARKPFPPFNPIVAGIRAAGLPSPNTFGKLLALARGDPSWLHSPEAAAGAAFDAVRQGFIRGGDVTCSLVALRSPEKGEPLGVVDIQVHYWHFNAAFKNVHWLLRDAVRWEFPLAAAMKARAEALPTVVLLPR